tara:strand:+ start:643 stop:969 length:327 start_codon:yes stop_codon:yes gene_type:complete
MSKNIRTSLMNKPNPNIDVTTKTYRFFGYTTNKERFTFNVKSHNYPAAVEDLFKMLDPNFIWQLNCELPGVLKFSEYFDAYGKKQNKTEHVAGPVKSLPVHEYQDKKH